MWRIHQSLAPPETLTVLEGHSSSVNCLAAIGGSNVVVSGAADSTVKVWRLSFTEEGLHVENVQTVILSPKCFPLSLALHHLESSSPKDLILAVAGTRSTIQVLTSNENAHFSLQHSLTGHEGWVRSLAFSREDASPDSDLLLASASQDKYIRLWRISRDKNAAVSEQTDLLGTFEQSLSNKTHNIKTAEGSHVLTFEALLLGHEDWVYTVSWYVRQDKLQLLSASEDNSLAIWEREKSSGVWIPTTRLGEISSLKGSTTATGSAGGFWTGLWSPTGEQLASLGRTGSWRLWNYDQSQEDWLQVIGISGHTKPVKDIAWSKQGSYLLSTGLDQTTRLHAEWKRGSKRSWHEMARPQIHGYDLNCIDSIGNEEIQFISGADEKLLRVFDEPKVTADLLDNLCGIKIDAHGLLLDTANIPVLGLSNKATHVELNHEPSGEDAAGVDEYEAPNVRSFTLSEKTLMRGQPPSEDQLAKHTLWPELEKLYGHGHEISAVAVSPLGNVVATACKASSQDHAVIRLFTTKDWHEIKPPLIAHSLTVTSLRFSFTGCYLLSVGRDRQWTVWSINSKDPNAVDTSTSFVLKCSDPKGHSRMILNANWAPIRMRDIFATAGRDKCAKIWSINETQETFDCVASITETSAVTAVAVAGNPVGDNVIVAVGTEAGRVSLHFLHMFSWEHKHMQELGES